MVAPVASPAPVVAKSAAAPVEIKKEGTQYIEVKSEQDGRVYAGDFTFRRLNIGQIAKVGVETCRLNGGFKVDDNTDFLNTMLATFVYAIVKAPDWWKPEELFDYKIAGEVYNKYLEFEATFRQPPK